MGAIPADSILVEGRSIRITNPDRVLYPEQGITKADVISYYLRASDRLLPHVRRRPVTRIRWPHGVTGQPFFEKQLPSHAPSWIKRITLEHSDGTVTYPLVSGASTLAWFAQQNALELHVPQWRTYGSGRRTDRLVLDLDPGPSVGLPECAEVALWLRDRLNEDGLTSVPVTSGSKGIHIYAKWLAARHPGSTSDYAKELAKTAERALPSLVTANMAKEGRRSRVLIDWSQNNPSKTTICPYSLRGRLQPTVAAPRDWPELTALPLAQVSILEMAERLSEPDPLSAFSDESRRGRSLGGSTTR